MKNKTKKPILGNNIRTGERLRLEGVIRQQADKLKTKNGQLRNDEKKHILSEEQIRILSKAMEAAADGIFVLDAQKTSLPVIYANHDVDPRIVEKIKKTIRDGKSFRGEVFKFQKNGRQYWSLLRITSLRDPGGAVTHYIGIQTDVTLLQEREIEVDEQREELLHVTRVGKLAEFVSSLAHEISQPLTAILSYAQAAQRMLAGMEPEIQKILQHIIDDDHRASEIIQRMRSLLKKGEPEIAPLDINVLINETIVLIATDAAVRNDMIKTELDGTLPLVRGDWIQLQQVILNLISNSFDALEGSQGKREISICTSRKSAGTIIVEVKDSGRGIPPKNLPKLFTRFFTSKPDGLGMGLSISRSIIEAHGGQLNAKNNPGRGATFYFTIPVGAKDA